MDDENAESVHAHSVEYARQLDKLDELSSYRSQFYMKKDQVYLDGNSLGLLSKRAEQSLLNLLDSWRQLAIDGWTEGDYPWLYLSETLAEMSAPLVGADVDEVIVTGSTTVNLHQLVSTFYKPTAARYKILADELAFPTDIYALQSQLMLQGIDSEKALVKVKTEDGHTINEDEIVKAMSDDISLVVLPSIMYRSGQILDMKKLTRAAHQRGIKIGFDLCHSIGAVPHQLSEWDVDFAFWCNYKHVNGGPGAVGGLYVNQRHFSTAPGMAGWFGSKKEKQFDMEHIMTPADDAGRFQMGTPHLLSLAPLIGSLSMFHEVGIDKIRKKSLSLTAYMMELIDAQLNDDRFRVCSPRDTRRGGHVFLEHPDAARICKALKAEGVIPDFRAPDGIRLAPVAFYNSFEDVWKSVQTLKKIMDEELYKKYENKRGVVA